MFFLKQEENTKMKRNIEYLYSDMRSVRQKERELRKAGYRSKDLIDENLLEHDEYLLRTPIRKSSSGRIGWSYMSILWRTS